MVRLRDRVGLNVSPLFLRITLGIVFLWAGLGKVSQTFEVSGEAAATLANMGAIAPPRAMPAPPAPAAPATPPETKPPAPSPEEKPAEKPPEKPTEKPTEKPGGRASAGDPAITLARFQQKQFTAADFPTPVHVRLLYGVALAINAAANPAPTDDGKPRMCLWPKAIGEGPAPMILAWAVALTELCGGAAVLIGLLTRLAAVALAGVMLGAMWLTQFGPAIQAGTARLGFLPGHDPFDGAAWQTLLIQFALFGAAMALAFAGPGRLSLDGVLLSGRKEDDEE